MIIVIDIIKFIVLLWVTFSACQIITNKNKRISYIGTILICVSTAVIQYMNDGLIEALVFGEGIFIGISKLIHDAPHKYFWSIFVPICLAGFLVFSNKSFDVSIGLTMTVIIVCDIMKATSEKLEFSIEKLNKNDEGNDKKENNKLADKIGSIKANLIDKNIEVNQQNDNKINEGKKIRICKKLDSKYIVLIIGCVISIIASSFFFNDNKMENVENINGTAYLMNYTYSAMLPFNSEIKFENSEALATMISIFPVGLLLAVIYSFKKDDKHTKYLMISSIVSIIEIILLITGKLNFVVPNYILAIGFALLQIYMLIYIFANIEERIFTMIKAAYVSLLGIIVIMLVPFPSAISEINKRVIPYMIFVLESFIVLNYTDKRFWRLASWVFTIICLFETIGYMIVKFM